MTGKPDNVLPGPAPPGMRVTRAVGNDHRITGLDVVHLLLAAVVKPLERGPAAVTRAEAARPDTAFAKVPIPMRSGLNSSGKAWRCAPSEPNVGAAYRLNAHQSMAGFQNLLMSGAETSTLGER